MCLPSIAPMQLGNCHLSQNVFAISLNEEIVGSGICFFTSVFQIASHTSTTITATVLFEILKEYAICLNCIPVAKYLKQKVWFQSQNFCFYFSEETVKGRWKNLRDTFNRELKKVHKSRSGEEASGPCRYKGTWCYFEDMDFLKRIIIN